MEKIETNLCLDQEIIKAFEPVMGFSEIKEKLMILAKILKENSRADYCGINEPSGLFLFGIGAMGKTLLAECLIQASGRMSFDICFDKPDPNWGKKIHSVFEEALNNAPSIVYLDDLDTYIWEDRSNAKKIEKELIKCIDSVRGKHVFVLVTCDDGFNYSKEVVSEKRIDLRIFLDSLDLDKKSSLEILSSSFKELKISSDLTPADIVEIFGRPFLFEPAQFRIFVQGAADEAVQLGYATIRVSNYVHAYLAVAEEVPWHAFHLEQRDINTKLMFKKAYEIAAQTALLELFYPGITGIAGIYWFRGPMGIIQYKYPYQYPEVFSKDIVEENRCKLIIKAASRMINIMKFGRIEKTSYLETSSGASMLSDLDSEGIVNPSEIAYLMEDSDFGRHCIWILMVEAEKQALYLLKKNELFVNALAEEIFQKGFLLAEQIQQCRRKVYKV